MKDNLVILDFSRIYERENFYKNKNYNWIDCTRVQGTNGYCDNTAFKKLENKVKDYSPEGMHFLDSGNYHYASELWIEKIKKQFTLVVFDHHSDMMKSKFGDILSCGSWILDSIKSNKYLKKVVIIGLSNEQKKSIPQKYSDKVMAITDKDIKCEDTLKKIDKIKDKLPVYISIDKDVFSKEIVNTSWDQGKMNLKNIKRILASILNNDKVIGIDVCGENSINNFEAISNNDIINSKLIDILL